MSFELSIKTVQQEKLTLKVDTNFTILKVKELLSELKGWPVENQKLIYSGKILKDVDTVEALGVKEGDFFVAMVTKEQKKTKPVPSQTPPSTQPAPTPSIAPVVPVANVNANPQSSNAETTQPTPKTFDASTLATGAAFESAVTNMIEMGFEREHVLSAMKASFNNPDRAVDYLMNGIPDFPQEAPQADQADEATPQAAQSGLGDLSFLANNPQFQQLRMMIQQNPAMLEPLLQQLAQSNPQLFQLISQNQQEFLQLLSGGEGGEALPPNVIQITPEENEAIERLMNLGFSKEKCVEAFFACDKNENVAANYLFEMNDDE